MKLNLPIYRQAKESVDCGPVCLKMLLEYYGIKLSLKKLKSKIRVYKDGIYTAQLADFFLKNNFNVEIVTLNPKLFTKRDEKKKNIDLVSHFQKLLTDKETSKKLKEDDKRGIKYFIKFVKNKGKIKIKIPDEKDLKTEIKNKRPVIAILTTNFLLGKKPRFNLHYNVVTGIDKKYVYVNDPLWDYRGGKHRYLIKDFLFGLYASSYPYVGDGSLMKIKKK
ncbi:C39 family peptidase [Candidatus Woesearchaeota archaeon]|nr:C39 family peptidase [Candidatus Woesearchaeota archaeon]